MGQALARIRLDSNDEKMKLDDALEMAASDPRRKQFADASAIMKRVQRKYERVCERSLEPLRKLQQELPPPSRHGATSSRLSRLALAIRREFASRPGSLISVRDR